MPDSTELVQPAADAAAAVREPGVFAAIRQAVAGTRASYDYTEGSIGRAILLLAIPMVLEMLMESVFVVCDVFYVSHITRDAKEAVATVGFTESLMTLVYTLAIGLSIGTMATVARRIGERDREGAARTAAQTIALGLVVSVVLGILGATLAPRLLALMGADAGVIEKGSSFTRVMLGCNASVVMLILINAVFRGSGDAAVAMRVLWLANIINILLGPCLIYSSAVARVKGLGALRNAWGPATVVAGIATFGAYALVLLALQRAAAAPVAAVRETSVVIAALLARRVLQETVGVPRIAGAAAVAGGIALLSLT